MDGQIHSIPNTAIRGCEDMREYGYYISPITIDPYCDKDIVSPIGML